MLERLTVENYALIRELEMVPGEGFIIITGETGAGKSIMLGALSLLLGERADSSVISDKSRKAVIEAQFSGIDGRVAEKVKEIDPEWEGWELIVRREISPSGRSRAFVNDTPVKLGELSEVTLPLFDIHSQHSNRLLSLPEHQLQLVDIMAENGEEKREYQRIFSEFVSTRSALRKLQQQKEETGRNVEMYKFQLAQLDELNPKPGELGDVEKRFDILSYAEDIRERLNETNFLLTDEDTGILSLLNSVESALSGIDLSLFSKRGESSEDMEHLSLPERLEQISIELRDIAETVSHMASEVEPNPAELSRVTKRMNQLYEANRTFKISEEDGLVKLRERLRKAVKNCDGDDRVDELNDKLRNLAHELKVAGAKLSESRERGAKILTEKLLETAIPLGLSNMKFEIHRNSGKFTKDGGDNVEFWCSFNKSIPVAPLSKIASGGEISRIMLSLRKILAGKIQQPTVIFDEIDTGVSGEIADRMGRMMREMGRNMQVLAITHLPQVAARGDRHFKVFKHDLDDRTVSEMRLLSKEERVREIAGMVSGEEINEAALRNASALLKE